MLHCSIAKMVLLIAEVRGKRRIGRRSGESHELSRGTTLFDLRTQLRYREWLAYFGDDNDLEDLWGASLPRLARCVARTGVGHLV